MRTPHGNEMGAAAGLTYGGAAAFPLNNKPAARFFADGGCEKTMAAVMCLNSKLRWR